MDDLSNVLKTSRGACYADDTKIFKSIDSITDCNALQSDLNNLVSWSESSGLIFNQSKCKYQCITSKKITCTTYLYYQRNASGILRHRERPWCAGVKQSYLGKTSIWTVCESQQTPQVCAPSFLVHPSTQTHRTLYLSIVRCHLGYATQVWSPQSIGLLKRVENVQRRATKLMLKLPFHCDVTYKTLQLTHLLPISYWHEFLDTVFFYKAVNNLVFKDSKALPVSRQFTRSTRSSSSSAITYIPKRSRTVTYRRSFLIRACRTWNVLPAELRKNHISLASFKSLLLK